MILQCDGKNIKINDIIDKYKLLFYILFRNFELVANEFIKCQSSRKTNYQILLKNNIKWNNSDFKKFNEFCEEYKLIDKNLKINSKIEFIGFKKLLYQCVVAIIIKNKNNNINDNSFCDYISKIILIRNWTSHHEQKFENILYENLNELLIVLKEFII